VTHNAFYIDGEWTPPLADAPTLDVVNPTTEEIIATVAAGGAQDVDRAVAAAQRAQEPWAATEPKERARVLRVAPCPSKPQIGPAGRLPPTTTQAPSRRGRLDSGLGSGPCRADHSQVGQLAQVRATLRIFSVPWHMCERISRSAVSPWPAQDVLADLLAARLCRGCGWTASF
jgi:hypothetical protein